MGQLNGKSSSTDRSKQQRQTKSLEPSPESSVPSTPNNTLPRKSKIRISSRDSSRSRISATPQSMVASRSQASSSMSTEMMPGDPRQEHLDSQIKSQVFSAYQRAQNQHLPFQQIFHHHHLPS